MGLTKSLAVRRAPADAEAHLLTGWCILTSPHMQPYLEHRPESVGVKYAWAIYTLALTHIHAWQLCAHAGQKVYTLVGSDRHFY